MTIRLRPAEMADAALMYEWQSHPTTRRYSRNPDMPGYEVHVAWLARKLGENECRFHVIEADGYPAGVLRFDQTPTGWEVSIVVAPEYRGEGVGDAALRAGVGAVPEDETVTAFIMPENTASVRLFTGAGFMLCPDGLYRYVATERRTAVIVQARMGSTRLPGKVMMDLHGKPVIRYVLERCLLIGANAVVLALPDEEASLPVAEVARDLACPVYFGPEDDVLARYVGAAEMIGADVVMRVTADCPLIDPRVCRQVLNCCATAGPDYVSNIWPNRTFPKGLDCEAFTIDALRGAHLAADSPYDREHVTPWIQRQAWARDCGIENPFGNMSETNLCVDHAEDLERLRQAIGEAA